jgi:6-phosphogluconolactonase
VHPGGKFLYVSNRGMDTIAVFGLDEKGTPAFIRHVSTGGRTPRGFNIDPSGNWLIAANQNSDNLVVFRMTEQGGGLEQRHVIEEVGKPVSIVFVPAGR